MVDVMIANNVYSRIAVLGEANKFGESNFALNVYFITCLCIFGTEKFWGAISLSNGSKISTGWLHY